MQKSASCMTCLHLVQSQIRLVQGTSKSVQKYKADLSTSLNKSITSLKKNVEESLLGLESSGMISCWQNVGLFNQR